MSHTPHPYSPLLIDQGNGYLTQKRDDVLQLIAEQKLIAKRVLELGCSAGVMGEALKKQLAADRYVGIELNQAAADAARRRLDEVHVADLNTATAEQLGLVDHKFELLLILDLLEHLYDPWEALARWSALVEPGGHLVLSIPNVQNLALIANLAAGFFQYMGHGILDATHIRFFSLSSIHDLVRGAGFDLRIVRHVHSLDPQRDKLQPTGNSMTLGQVTIRDLTAEDVQQLCTVQYLIVARRRGA